MRRVRAVRFAVLAQILQRICLELRLAADAAEENLLALMGETMGGLRAWRHAADGIASRRLCCSGVIWEVVRARIHDGPTVA
jgi:hypothetical protein